MMSPEFQLGDRHDLSAPRPRQACTHHGTAASSLQCSPASIHEAGATVFRSDAKSDPENPVKITFFEVRARAWTRRALPKGAKLC